MTSIAATIAAGPIAKIFSFNDGFVRRVPERLTQEELWRAPTSSNNLILRIAGHVVQTRAMVLQMLGEAIDAGWVKLFDRAAKIRDGQQYSAGTNVTRVMRGVSVGLRIVLSARSTEQLNRPASLPIPGINTLADELPLSPLHDSYHVSQPAYIRKTPVEHRKAPVREIRSKGTIAMTG